MDRKYSPRARIEDFLIQSHPKSHSYEVIYEWDRTICSKLASTSIFRIAIHYSLSLLFSVYTEFTPGMLFSKYLSLYTFLKFKIRPCWPYTISNMVEMLWCYMYLQSFLYGTLGFDYNRYNAFFRPKSQASPIYVK